MTYPTTASASTIGHFAKSLSCAIDNFLSSLDNTGETNQPHLFTITTIDTDDDSVDSSELLFEKET